MPWPWNAGACLRGACAELARGLREREHGAIFRTGTTSSVVHMNLARRLRLGAGLLNPGGAPPSNEEVKSYQRCCHAPFV